ncbi:hypothetical protein FB45DRAFT_873315 [Roridomyces roridus]|uniref:Uncharacterized protein n=1 Tax=Roridomyces roridus TaxID=1738132 RepID=A0AAD7FEY1_9AGAR|nr:hypothetical protein FB45DRAFT_873315 [Roridomyces roridus]
MERDVTRWACPSGYAHHSPPWLCPPPGTYLGPTSQADVKPKTPPNQRGVHVRPHTVTPAPRARRACGWRGPSVAGNKPGVVHMRGENSIRPRHGSFRNEKGSGGKWAVTSQRKGTDMRRELSTRVLEMWIRGPQVVVQTFETVCWMEELVKECGGQPAVVLSPVEVWKSFGTPVKPPSAWVEAVTAAENSSPFSNPIHTTAASAPLNADKAGPSTPPPSRTQFNCAHRESSLAFGDTSRSGDAGRGGDYHSGSDVGSEDEYELNVDTEDALEYDESQCETMGADTQASANDNDTEGEDDKHFSPLVAVLLPATPVAALLPATILHSVRSPVFDVLACGERDLERGLRGGKRSGDVLHQQLAEALKLE